MSHRGWPGQAIVGLVAADPARVLQRERQVATAGQFVFDLSGLGYTPGINSLMVFANGLLLENVVDYLEMSATQVMFTSARTAGDELVFVAGEAVNNTSSADASLVVYQPANPGAVATSVQAKLRELPSVIDFGADSSGVADSTAAFNLLTARLRALFVNTPDYDYAGFSLTIPPGVYSVSTWDLTNLLTQNVHVMGHGAVLVARTAGKHVVDCLGSRYIKFHGLMIYSASGVVAKSGVQLGPKGTETCGNFAFNDVTIAGYFASAPFMNLGAETVSHRNLRLIQRATGAGVFALIADGLSTYLPTSDYAAVTRTPGVAVSFTACGFVGSQIRNEGGGSAAYLGQTQGWAFDLNTYWLSFNDSAVVVHGTGTYRSARLTLRGSFESSTIDTPTAGNTGLKHAVTFSNDGTNTAIDGFAFESSNMHAGVAVFRAIGGGTYRLSDADIRVHGIEGATAVMFGAGSMSVDGMLMTQSSAKANLGALTSFNGMASVDAYASLLSAPVAGAWTIWSRSDNKAYNGGNQQFPSAFETFAPTVTFATPGDLSVSYAAQSGWLFKLGKLVFMQIALTFTPTYTTASGELRIAGLPYGSNNLTNEDAALPVSNINSAWTWPAGTTEVVARLPANSTNVRLYGHASGVASTVFQVAHVPSGSAKSLTVSGCFMAA